MQIIDSRAKILSKYRLAEETFLNFIALVGKFPKRAWNNDGDDGEFDVAEVAIYEELLLRVTDKANGILV